MCERVGKVPGLPGVVGGKGGRDEGIFQVLNFVPPGEELRKRVACLKDIF